MFLKWIKQASRSTGAQLNFWYSGIFFLSGLLMVVVFYGWLSFTIERKDREVIESRLVEYAAIYQGYGIQTLSRQLDRRLQSPEERSYFVQIIGNGQVVLLSKNLEIWRGFDFKALDLSSTTEVRSFIRIPRDHSIDFTVGFSRFSDGVTLVVGRNTANRETLLEPYRKMALLVLSGLVALGVGGGIWFSHHALQPIRKILETTQTIISTGRLEERIPVRETNDELDELVGLLNLMLARNQELIGRLKDSLDNVAHDLRTPLTRMRGVAELALRSEGSGEGDGESAMREALADCVEEADRVLMMLKSVMDVSEAEAGVMRLKWESVRLVQLVEEVMDLYELVAEEKGVEMVREVDSSLRVRVDVARFRQVLANLVDNALKYNREGGRVTIRGGSDGDGWWVEVEDTGMGIPEEERDKIWNRLYRGDKSRSRRGLGLGLSLVKAIVSSHGGQVAVVKSEVDVGSVFRVWGIDGD